MAAVLVFIVTVIAMIVIMYGDDIMETFLNRSPKRDKNALGMALLLRELLSVDETSVPFMTHRQRRLAQTYLREYEKELPALGEGEE